MKNGSTLFLRASLVGMGLIVLTVCFFVIPSIFREWGQEFPHLSYWRYAIAAALTITAVAFFAAEYQAMKLLNYVDKNQAFSKRSVRALKNIKYAALVISTMYAGGMPLVYQVANKEDAPGLILFAMFFVFTPLAIAVFTSVAQRLLQNAIAIKSENDLTV